jgi:hypothetical protein
MSTPSWMQAPSGRCVICNQELGPDPHFIVEPPDGEHLRCIDWSSRPWPFARLEKQIAARRRALAQAIAVVVDLGTYLARARSLWPDRLVVEVVEARRRIVGAALDRAGWRTSA